MYKEQIDTTRLPRHIAIIMDGNGRWAKERGYERIYGHQNGVESVRAVIEAATELGIENLTLYAFSTENWGRSQKEIDALMDLLVKAIVDETANLKKNNIRLTTIGDIDRMPLKTRTEIEKCIEETKGNTRLNLIVALSYSSRWEITEAVKNIAREAKEGKIDVDNIDDKLVSKYLTTRDIPDPDLLIRTSGEYRISNFLLWQIAYSELYFTPVTWPDFGKENFYEAIVNYQNRERRFGK